MSPSSPSTQPAMGTIPHVGFSPTTPQHDAGMRMEPPASVPMAAGARPAESAAAEPPLEPPATRSGSHGFLIGPVAVTAEVVPIPHSCRFAYATTTAPARLSLSITSAVPLSQCPPILEPTVGAL